MAHVTFTTSNKIKPGIYFLILVTGLIYVVWNLALDMSKTSATTSFTLYLTLGTALIIALGFEFINGFHDSANAVATVIYTHALTPNTAVLWSGIWNFLGTLTSSGAVAYAIINLLPIDLLLQVGHSRGIAMIFALLLAAIIWNLGTWWLGLPSSSSHTLIGSIIGIGLTNQLLTPQSGASHVDWSQALKIFQALFFSPLIGFISAGLLMLLLKTFCKHTQLYTTPTDHQPPPFMIRALLIVTSGGVSFSHGLNDGQKGMGLVMLILVATVPTAYALNDAVIAAPSAQSFNIASQQAVKVLDKYIAKNIVVKDERATVMQMLIQHKITGEGVAAQKQLIDQIGKQVLQHSQWSLNTATLPTHSTRKDIYLANEALQLMLKLKQPAFTPADNLVITNYRQQLNYATQYIPPWVKVIVAVTLGLGTMVGWKRIVTTVGEKIGKAPLNYAQGVVTQLVTMLTITTASCFGLPVSTVHILSSGVAGSMVSHKIPLQRNTVRNILLAWIFTLPISILLAGGLFSLLLQCVR
jgi:PiT family inorganic phosphate transporter